jgi:triphosphoribosyl-dephospho-CoA synthase
MISVDVVIGLHAQVACIWEATARKPGNVYPYHDFADTGYLDFLTSAAAIAPVLAEAPHQMLGEIVLEAVRRTREVARGNTNLGIVLLLAPLAKAEGERCNASPQPLKHPSPQLPPRSGEGETESDFRAAIESVLRGLTIEDAERVYSAIALACPGGLGQVPQQDVRAAPTVSLREAMALAAERDLIARQYANGFAEVFDAGAPAVLAGIERTVCLEGAIIHAHLHLMSRFPDTLIARKRGRAEAAEAARRATAVLAAGWPKTAASRTALEELDGWLRAEGHQRNPGTTADLIAASLFVLLRQGQLRLPSSLPWSLPAIA